ncbi:MAG: NAD(P)/FAD-dependent oxidoreductase [Ignavibacteriaceae bacterium]
MENKKVVIIGAGFGGLLAAQQLKNSEYDITIVDKTNYHLFQPLLYQVATAALSPGDIAFPIRSIFSGNKNVKVLMGEVININKEKKIVELNEIKLPFDYLIIATGARHSYFGNNEWEHYAPGLKTIHDALFIREKILRSLEEAEKCNPEHYQRYLTYIIIGGGPTGVEMAGAIAEIAKKAWLQDFRNIDASKTQVYLVEALPRILTTYPEELSNAAREQLEEIGVKVLLNTKVTDVNEKGIQVGDKFIESANIIWAAGNVVSPLLKSLNVELDRAGRVLVNSDLSISGSPDIFVIGDAAAYKLDDGSFLPGIAPVAMQQGRFVSKLLKEKQPPGKRDKFKYNDRGIMATIGRAKAIAFIKGFKLTGFFAWAAWSFVHIMFLIGFRNRIRVMMEWAWYYITFRHGIRLITGQNNKYYY